jgi:hypothetical protein
VSSTGQIVGGILGGVVGSAVGNPWLGAQIGMGIGGYIDPPKGPKADGPRVGDLSVQTSTYGAPLARLYGTVVTAGNVFWVENGQLGVVYTKQESGGKGGSGKQTTKVPAVYGTFAVGLGEGEIVGVLRIWVGPNLYYNAGSNDTATILASNAAAEGFRIYTGSDTQLPDPRMQATLGVDNTPAWRGVAYIVFYDLPLEKYGNSLQGAQVKVEVMTTGAVYSYPYAEFSGLAASIWQSPAWDGTVYCSPAYFQSHVVVSADGLTWQQYAIPNGAFDTYQGVASDGAGTLLVYGSGGASCWRSTNHGVTWSDVSFVGGFTTQIVWNGGQFLAITDTGPFFTSPNGLTWTSQAAPGSGSFGKSLCWHPGSSKWYIRPVFGTGRDILSSPHAVAGTWSVVYTMPATFNNYDKVVVHNGRILYKGVGTVATVYGGAMVWSDDGVTWSYSANPGSGESINSDGTNVFIDTGGGYGNMWISADGVTGWYLWFPPSTTSTPILNASNFNSSYANGFIVAMGKSGGTGYRVAKQFSAASDTNLASIVSAESLRSGLLTAGDIDVVDLTQMVHGYRIGNPGTLRSAISPLQASWPFDVVQRGYKIKFKGRLSPSVGVIDVGDLDARGAGEAPGVAVTLSREMDSQLPRRVSIQFLDLYRNQDLGEQYAERLNTPATNVYAHQLPIVLSAAEAAGKAEVLLYLAWLERFNVAFSLPVAIYGALEPGDVIDLPTDEGTLSLRVTAINYTSDARLEVRAKYNFAPVYTPAALGADGASLPVNTIVPAGPVAYELLDIPQVHDAQAGPAFVAAMGGTLDGWQGGALMQSVDAGASWASLQDFAPPGATLGYASNSIGAVDSRLLDKGSQLAITLINGELFDVTQAAMLAGANYFAYGQGGRWEIIAAQLCTLQGGNDYILSDLLRGRFGTEWAMGLHVAGDTLVLLDTDEVAAIAVSSSSIGLQRLYRGITVGRDISTDVDRAFTYQAVNVRPLSPIELTGHREASGNWALRWVRRTRGVAEMRDYVDADLGETSEAYQVDIFADGSYAARKRTLSVATSAAAYSNAEQVSDFGSAQATLYLKVYQMSAAVGRGYALTQSLTR